MAKEWVAGIELGGTNATVAIGNSDVGFIDDSVVSEPADFLNGDANFTEQMLRLLFTATKKASTCFDYVGFVGIASAGQPTREGHIERAANCPFTMTFPAILGKPLRIVNDVAGATYGAMKFGYGSTRFREQGRPRFDAAMTIGTGTNIQLLIDGELYANESGQSCEWGHIAIESRKTGRLCGCGSRGCGEAYFSGSGIGLSAAERLLELYIQRYKRDDKAMLRDNGILEHTLIRLKRKGIDTERISVAELIANHVSAEDVFNVYTSSRLAREIVDEGVEHLAVYFGNVMHALPSVPYVEVFGTVAKENPWYVKDAVQKLRCVPAYHGNRDPDSTKWLVTDVSNLGLKGTVAMALHYAAQK